MYKLFEIYRNRPLIYWWVIVAMAVSLGFVELAIAYNGIVSCNAQVIQYVGRLSFFSKILFFIIGRNLALNFFPFLLRERQHFQQSLEKEVKVVYQTVRMFDVTDIKNKLYLVNIDDIFYCYQQRNSTDIHLVQDVCYYRLGFLHGQDSRAYLPVCLKQSAVNRKHDLHPSLLNVVYYRLFPLIILFRQRL